MKAERGTTMKRTLIAVAAVAALTVAILAVTLPGFAIGFVHGFGATSGLYWLGLLP
jgi:hypothetical protein